MSEYQNSQQFARFMVTTLFHQMSAWVDTINKGLCKKEFLYRLNNAVQANRLLVKEIEKNDDLTETLFEAGEQFAQIMQHLINTNKTNSAGAFTLLTMVEVMTGDELEEMEKLWKDLSVYIGQKRAKMLSDSKQAA